LNFGQGSDEGRSVREALVLLVDLLCLCRERRKRTWVGEGCDFRQTTREGVGMDVEMWVCSVEAQV
jgi:hypothetical protein